MKKDRVLVVIMKDDYGIPDRGLSYEYQYFYQSLAKQFRETKLFDYGPYLHRPATLQSDLLAAADAFQPDLIFFTLYTNQFEFQTLDKLSKKYLTVNWFCDDQWRFDDFSSRYCHHFRYVVTTDHFAVAKYHRIGYQNVILSQWATSEVLSAMPTTIEYKYDVTFVGGTNPYRKWFVEQLQGKGIPIEAFGTGWANGRLDYGQMNDVFMRSRINLNISNSKNYDIRFVLSSLLNFQNFRATTKNKEQIKGRHFEIPAFGGFQMTNYVEFLERYFEIGREISVYSSIDHLADLVRYYLEHESERQAIANAGYQRQKNNHMYQQRFDRIFQHISTVESRPT